MKRFPLILAVLIGIGVVAGLYWIGQDDSGRSDRRNVEVDNGREGYGTSGGSDSATKPAGALADAATVAKLIEKYGGFVTKGQLFLTRPHEAGVDLEVVFSATIDGSNVEARGKSDADGRFSLPQLPRGSDYKFEVESELLQPYSEAVPEPDGAELDLEHVYLDRFYFLTGRVVTSSGMAVKDAEAAVILPNGGSGFSLRSRAISASTPDPVAAQTKSGADGKFTIRMRDPGIFTLRVRADGWAPHYRGDVVVAAGGAAELRVSLTRGTEITGQVIDATGRPLPDATVSLFGNSRNWFEQVKELRQTDSDGRFEYRIEPQSDRYSVRVMPPSGVDVNKSFRLPLNDDLIIQLPGGATIKGRVVDAQTSQPISDAEVLLGIQGPGGSGWTPAYQKMLKTDSFGSYRLEGVGTDRIQSMTVSASGYANFAGSGWNRSDAWKKISAIKLDSAEEIQIPDVSLAQGRIVEGIVRDADSGEPIAGAKVTLNDMVAGNREFKTDGGGRFRVGDLGDRPSFRVEAQGYADVNDMVWAGPQLPADQNIVQREFELKPAGSVIGKVTTDSGAPVARALVRIQTGETGRAAWMGGARLRNLYTHTRADGTYVIDGVPPVKLKVEVKANGFERAETPVKTMTSGGVLGGMNVKLVASAVIGGMVVARGGGVVSGARITFVKDPGSNVDGMRRWRMFAGGVTAFTDEKGRFFAEDVPVGDLLLRVEAEGAATHEMRRRGVKPGEQITGMKITVKPALEITGRILNEDGEPITRAWVSARQTASPDGEPSDQQLGARVTSDGTFVIRNMPEGTYTISVRAFGGRGGPQYQSLDRTAIAAGTRDLAITLVKRDE